MTAERTLAPGSEGEVAEALQEAFRRRWTVLPLGTGVEAPPIGTARDLTPLRTEGMDGILEYEPADLTLTAGAGTSLAEVAAAAAEHGQWLPFDPPEAAERTLGGVAATGAPGPLSTMYGLPRDNILGLSVVTGDGQRLRLGGKVMKNVAGFDLVRLMVGSRGALGVITSVTVRLFPRPAVDRWFSLEAATPAELMAAGRAVATAPVLPASAVLRTRLEEGAGGALFLRLHGSPPTVEADRATFENACGRGFTPLEGQEGPGRPWSDGAVVTASALPSRLGALLEAAGEVFPGAMAVADVLSGRVHLSVGVPPSGGQMSKNLREMGRAVAELEGSVRLVRAAGARAEGARVGEGDADDAAARIRRVLKDRFDPEGVLWDGGAWGGAGS
ncbi:MAG: FAD-binding oxidoreductase [Gemmatimonadota bacterium]